MILDDANARLAALYAAHPGAWKRVLEAGAGSRSLFRLAEGAALVALDISFGQLIRNDETPLRVQGDLHALPLASGSVDMVVCFNVIEHLDDAGAAMAEMRRALSPGGLLVLGWPNPNSLKGLVTRATPIGVHRAWYRHIVGKRDRGEGHFDAFPTVFHPMTHPARLAAWMAENGFAVLWRADYDGVAEYGIAGQGWKRRIVTATYGTACAVGRLLSLGRWRPEHSDILLIAQLAATSAPPGSNTASPPPPPPP